LICLTVLVAPSRAPGAGKATATDALETFSVTYPSEWSAVSTTHGGASQVGLFARAPLDISVVVGSRPLDRREAALEPRELLDELVLLTVDNQEAFGNQVIDAGRVHPFVPDWPAFSVIATNAAQRKMITCWRFVVDDRLYTLTTMTDNAQASPELGSIVREIVESVEVLR
jgi:hypothetical protein